MQPGDGLSLAWVIRAAAANNIGEGALTQAGGAAVLIWCQIAVQCHVQQRQSEAQDRPNIGLGARTAQIIIIAPTMTHMLDRELSMGAGRTDCSKKCVDVVHDHSKKSSKYDSARIYGCAAARSLIVADELFSIIFLIVKANLRSLS
nr:hypothetical protein [Sphingobium agri]